jgi:aspartate kinase
MKFGGAVLRSKEGFLKMVEILRNYREEELLLIISAFATATSDLDRAAKAAEKGDAEKAYALAENVIKSYGEFSQNILADAATREALELFLKESYRHLKDYLRGVSITQELTPRTLDLIVSFGEYCSVHIARHFLKEQGFDVEFVDATNVIVTNDQHGAALPKITQTAERVEAVLRPAMKRGTITLTQGFVAKSESGEITTMGRESSNLTATLLAELLKAERVIIWSDVEGVRTADPKIIENSGCIANLDYAEAQQAAISGLKLLHPTMIEPVRRANIPLEYRSAFKNSGDYTCISSNTAEHKPFIAIQEQAWIVRVKFSSELKLDDREQMVDRLFSNPQTILLIQYLPDSLVVVSRRKPVMSRLPKIPGATLFKDYSVVSILNLPEERMIDVLPNVLKEYDGLITILGIGYETNVSRFAIPHDEVERFVKVLHDQVVS